MQLIRAASHFISLAIVVLLAGCASAPLDYPKTREVAISPDNASSLVENKKRWLAAQPDSNGFYPLIQGLDAFGARLALINAAEISIDAQYFLMKHDIAGTVFAKALIQAANRGVRVRFLLDDIFTTVGDEALFALNSHPNIELRIFNPISRKGIYAFNYLGHFGLANRRMHNKSFTVDNAVSIVGGRNIAVEYFQLETTGEFIDFDMLSAGPIVQEVSASFDDYWNHELAVPLEAVVDEVDARQLNELVTEATQRLSGEDFAVYLEAQDTEFMRAWFRGEIKPYFADATLVADEPQKLLEDISQEQKIVATAVGKALLQAKNEVILFTPYFIPREGGIELLRNLTERGVRVVVVTNSLATNNHIPVHSAYATYRKDLLRAGVELWEARADAVKSTTASGARGSGKLTLHTKGILIDRRWLFVGSLNLDPRSIDINTEMGVFIDSQEMGAQIIANGSVNIPRMAYRLQLGANDKITWHATIDGQQVVESTEPLTSRWTRFKAWFLKIAPENQL